MSLSPLGQEAQSPEVAMPSIRMKLDNTFATMQEDGKSSNMKVFARVRPMLQREEDAGYRECVGVIDEQVVRAVVPNTSAKFKNLSQNGQEIFEDFTYSQAFGPEIGQFVFFQQTIMDIMQGFIEGQNCLIFSYGITNSGKTFTLQGDEANPGIIPLAMRLFFASVKHQLLDGISVKPDKFADILMLNDKESVSETQLKEQLIQLSEQENASRTNSSGNMTRSFASTLCDCFNDDFEYETETTLPPEEMKAAQSALFMKELSKQSADQQEGLCNIWVSFVEIYNEYIYDLLQPNVINRPKLLMGEDQNGEVYVKGAREICVSSSDEALKLLNLGRRNLRIASTKLNYQSSRSHCIFTVKVVRLYDEENGRVNRISFCDLAGSERAAKSQTTGMHLKEAGYINTSILVLGKCLEQLRLNQSLRDKKMIPLRESKLTRLFSGHFQGKGRAVMIANASPCEYTFDETLNVLRFSALLKTLKLNDSYISAASSSLQNITNQWSKSKRISDVSFNESTDVENSLWEDIQEKDEMIEKLLDIADSLRNNLEKEKTEKAELEIKIRQEVCRENAEYSDQLIENQKRIAEDAMDSLKESHEKRVAYLVEMYEKRISDLMSQLRENESCTDESFMSINKGNDTIEIEDAENSKIIFESPAPVVKIEVKQFEDYIDAVNSPALIPPITSESLSVDVNSMEEIKSLQARLELITKELETAKERLELSSELLKTSQTEATMAKEECGSLRLELQKTEAISLEHIKESDALKTESLKKDNEVDNLKKDKKSLEENILFLSEELTVSTAEIKQLKEDKIKTDEYYVEQIEEMKQKIAVTDEKCQDLNQKLEDCHKSLSEKTTKIVELETKCLTENNDKTKLELEKKELHVKLCDVSEQLVIVTSELECLKTEKYDAESSVQKLMEDQKKVVATEEYEDLCSKLNKATEELAAVKSKYENLEVECENFRNHNSKLSTNYKNLEEKFETVSKLQIDADDRCKELELELEKAVQMAEDHKTVSAEMKSLCDSYKVENIKLTEDLKTLDKSIEFKSKKTDNEAELKCSKLSKQLEDANKVIQDLETKINQLEESYASLKSLNSELSSNLDVVKEKYSVLSTEHGETDLKFNELTEQFHVVSKALKDKETKIGQLEDDCALLKCENSELSTNCNIEKDKFSTLSEEHETTLEKERSQSTFNLERALQQLKDQKLKNNTLEEKCSDLSSQLEKASKDKEDQRLNIDNLENKTKELDTKLVYSKSVISELELKVEALESDCSVLKNDHAVLMKDYSSLEENFGSLKEKLGAKENNSDLQTQLDNLKEECDMHKNNYDKVYENYQTVDVAFKALTEDIGFLRVDYENLKKEKIAEADAHDKYVQELQSLNENYGKEVEDLSKQLNEAQSKKTTYENQIQQSNLDCALHKEKCTEIQTEISMLKAQFEETSSKNKEIVKEMVAKIAELKKCVSGKEDQIEELKKTNQSLEDNKAVHEANEVNIASYKEEIDNLKEELKRAKLLKEQSDQLCESLQKCEWHASNKIKLLDSSLVKYLDEIKDMRRQIREKNASIEELEKALGSSQKQVKDMDAQIKKEIASRRQDLARIEQIQHQKKLLETQVHKLQMANQQAENKNKEAKEAANVQVLYETENIEKNLSDVQVEENFSNATKGKKKRSFSVANEDSKNLTNKENSGSTSNDANKVQFKKPSKTTKNTKEVKEEKETLTKRRRVLRTQQPKAVEADDSFEIKEVDDDYEPLKKSGVRKKVLRSAASKEVEPAKPKTSRRKLQEVENMSPVKKAMQFVGSKFRSVAQTVSSMPSPRVTRGRKKLFNADAVSNTTEPKWKP